MNSKKEAEKKIIRLFQGGNLEIAVRDTEFPEDEFWINGLWFAQIITKAIIEYNELEKAYADGTE